MTETGEGEREKTMRFWNANLLGMVGFVRTISNGNVTGT